MGKKANILIAEVKLPLLQVTSRFLISLGFDVVAVESGLAMKEKLNAIEFDLVVLDLFFYSRFEEIIQSGLDKLQGRVPMIVLTNMGYDATLLDRLLKNETNSPALTILPQNDVSSINMSMSKTLPIQHLADNVCKYLSKAEKCPEEIQ